MGGLVDGRSYRVYVRAVNARGVSSSSPVLSVIAADLPVAATTAPTYLEIHPTSMTVQWAEPDPEYSNRDTPSTRGQVRSCGHVGCARSVPQPHAGAVVLIR